MTQPLSWNLHGNDQLSGVLEKLDRTLEKLAKHLDKVTGDAKQMGRELDRTETSSARAGRGLDHLSKDAEKAESRLDRLGRRARDMSSKMGSAFGSVSSVASAGLGAIISLSAAAAIGLGVAAGAAGAFAVKTAADNETAQISFEVLLGSAQKAQGYLAKLHAFAAATPFEMPQLRESASRLLAVGVATDRIIPLLTRLGDATSAMGTGAEGIDRAVYALQQMSQAGKVSLEDINQLTDAGIPALDALSAKLGTTVADLRKDISAGKIKPEELFQAILDGAGKTFPKLKGMMARQATTLSGLWSTFKDNTGQSLAKFAEPAIPGMKKVLDWLSTNIPKGLDTIRGMGADVAEIFDGSSIKPEFMAAMQKLGDKVLPALKKGWSDIKTYLEENREKLEKIGRWINEVGIPVFGTGLVKAIEGTASAITTTIDVVYFLVDAFVGGSISIITVLGDILDAAVWAFGWIPGIGPKLKESQKDFEEWSKGILDKLDRIDGKKVTVSLGFKTAERNAEGKPPPRDPFEDHNRAFGGPTWAGQTYTWNERGTEKFYANVSGRIESAADGRSRASRGGGEDMVTIRVIVETPTGKVIRTELLSYKRSSGLTSLGLA